MIDLPGPLPSIDTGAFIFGVMLFALEADRFSRVVVRWVKQGRKWDRERAVHMIADEERKDALEILAKEQPALSKLLEDVGTGLRRLNEEVTPNGGNTRKLGDTMQRLESGMQELLREQRTARTERDQHERRLGKIEMEQQRLADEIEHVTVAQEGAEQSAFTLLAHLGKTYKKWMGAEE